MFVFGVTAISYTCGQILQNVGIRVGGDSAFGIERQIGLPGSIWPPNHPVEGSPCRIRSATRPVGKCANADERIGAIVLTGAGPAFCADDDLVDQRSMLDADEAAITAFVDAI